MAGEPLASQAEEHGHGHGHGKGVIMRRPDGQPMTRQEVIVQRRGAFKWLPVLCSNDLVHGSWWFTWGSVVTTLFSIYPLVQKYGMDYTQEDDLLPASDFDITWALLIISGVFFTLGSIAFVRAFEEPPKRALFYYNRHFQSDELLGAWLFLFGCVPFVPYMLVFFLLSPSAFYFFSLCGAIIFVLGSYLFVAACYPSDNKHEDVILPLSIKLFGAQMWVVKHLANDWLAGTWFFLWANIVLTLGSGILLLIALAVHNAQQTFIWLSGFSASFMFLVGSYYFVSGSYPHATQFYYDTNQRGRSDSVAHEIYVDEIGLVNGGKPDLLGKQLRQSITTLASFNLFDDHPHPHLHMHLPQEGDQESGGVTNPIHEVSVKQTIDPRNKPTDFNKMKAAAAAATSKGKASSKSNSGGASLPPPPQKPLYQPVITSIQDTNQDDDDDDIDDSDRYHRHSARVAVDASSLVLPSGSSPEK